MGKRVDLHAILYTVRVLETTIKPQLRGDLFSSLQSTHVYRLAQSEMKQQKLEDALHEAQKPLARHLDDEDLDRMLREQEREGDPMAAMLRRKKERNTKMKGLKKVTRCLQNKKIIVNHFVEDNVNCLTFGLQRNRDIKVPHLLQTASIFYQATAGMESTGTEGGCICNMTLTLCYSF